MDNLDYSLIEILEQHKEAREKAEWQALIREARRQGSRMARFEFYSVVVIVILLAMMLETPH